MHAHSCPLFAAASVLFAPLLTTRAAQPELTLLDRRALFTAEPSISASDNFADRSFTGDYPLRLTASNANATKESGEPNHGNNAGGHSLWWGWTAPVPGQLTVTTAGSDFDTLLGVYTGTQLSSLTTIDSQDMGKSDEVISFHLQAGSSCDIAVDGYNGQIGDVVLNLSFIPSAANDDFANRTVIPGSTATVTGDSAAATKEPGEPQMIAGYNGGASLWWSWTAPATGLLNLTTEGSDHDVLLSIWTGTVVSELTNIGQQDRTPFENLTVRVFAETTYNIAVDGYLGRTGGVVLNLSFGASPLNDNFANRSVLTGTNISLTASNINATFEDGEPRHASKDGGKSVWWTWTPSSSGPCLISTEGSTFDTVLAVYTGDVLSNLTSVASSDLTLGDTVIFSAAAGTTYQIAVDGYAGREGVFPLRLLQSVPTPLSASAFDVDRDFWTVISLPDTGPFTNAIGSYVPSYIATGGNPGGYISEADPDGATWFWSAPPKLLGDQSLAYGGALTFDLRQSATDSQFDSADLVLLGPGNTALLYIFTNYPGTNWTSYSVPLTETVGWVKDTLNGSAPSQTEFVSVLGSLQAVYIRGEYRNGTDTGDLDNAGWVAPQAQTLFDNENIYAVQNGPAQPTSFTLTESAVVSYLRDYHYFNNGVEPGTIALRYEDGTLYGPWQTSGLTGQGGVANAYWLAKPFVTLKPGTYTVVDSDPATWSQNSESGFAGFTVVQGYFPAAVLPVIDLAAGSDGQLTISWPSAISGFSLYQSPTIEPAAWTQVTDQPVNEYGKFVVRIVPSARMQFYRLSRAP